MQLRITGDFDVKSGTKLGANPGHQLVGVLEGPGAIVAVGTVSAQHDQPVDPAFAVISQ